MLSSVPSGPTGQVSAAIHRKLRLSAFAFQTFVLSLCHDGISPNLKPSEHRALMELDACKRCDLWVISQVQVRQTMVT